MPSDNLLDDEKFQIAEKSDEQSEIPGHFKERVPWICTSRVALAFIGFWGFCILYALRINMSVAMVCMINQTAAETEYNNQSQLPQNESRDDDLMCSNVATNQTKPSFTGEFTWNKELQGLVLGAFFWGYLVTQLPGGFLSQRFGGKRVFGYSMLLAATATLLSTLAARVSPYLLIFFRILVGLGEGVAFPCMHNLWASWAPPLERSKLIGFTIAGCQIGNVLTLPISALLCEYGFDGGWGSIFYIFGILCVVWVVLWLFLVSDTPAQHPRITDEERNYIATSIGSTKHDKNRSTPWKHILTSMPVWAIVVAQTCSNWGTYTLLTNIPTYMREVLKFDIKSNGFFSALPYIVFWLLTLVASMIADKLRTIGWSTKTVRKIVQGFGNIVPGVLLIVTGYITCERPYAAVAVLSLAVGFSGFQTPGVFVNHVDIAPPFSGVLFGFANTFATLSGVFAPYLVGKLTTYQTQAEWQVVFYISAAVYTAGFIFYAIFADGELQDWVRPYMFDDDKPSMSLTVGRNDYKMGQLGGGGQAFGRAQKRI